MSTRYRSTVSEKTHAYPRSRPKNFLSHPRSIQQSQYGRHCLYDPLRLSTHPVVNATTEGNANKMNYGSKLGESYYEDSDRVRMFRKEYIQRPSTAGRVELEELVAKGWSEGTWLTERTNNSSSLALENYKLNRVPREVCAMTYLVCLNLSNNSISKLPRAIGNLTKLTELDVSFNMLSTIPVEIGQDTLKATTQFAVGGLLNLTILKLNNNKITILPNSISRLVNLTSIDMENNEMSELPTGIGKWRSIQSLEPHANQLTELPAR